MAGLDFHALFDASPNPYLVLNRRLHIVGANLAYLAGVKRDLSDIVGHLAWDACPAPDEIVRQAVASVERVIRTKRTDVVFLLRFDVPCLEAEGGGFVERYWSVKHTPVLDAEGEVALILQHPIDVAALQHVRGAVERNGLESALNITPVQSGIVGRARRTTTASTSSECRTPPSRSGAPRGTPSRGQWVSGEDGLAGRAERIWCFPRAPDAGSAVVNRTDHSVHDECPGFPFLS